MMGNGATAPGDDRSRCLRAVNSGLHAPHPLNLGEIVLKPLKPGAFLILVASPAPRNMLNPTIALAVAAVLLVEIMVHYKF